MDATKLSSQMNKILKKYANNKGLYIIIIIGVVFMLIAGGEQKDDYKVQTFRTYSDEERLSSVLEEIKGAGHVSVMITYYGSTRYDIAFEEKESSTSSDDEISQSHENSVITKGGEPLVRGEEYPEVRGVMVTATGADDVAVKKAITDAVSATLGIAQYRVCVLEGKDR